MKIPKSFRLGRTKYKIVMAGGSNTMAGWVLYGLNTIGIVQRYKGKLRTPKQQSETFWHEVTHAILHDMDHSLRSNEAFVNAFSERLNQVVHTAKLER